MDEKLIVTRDAFKHGTGTPSGVPDFIGQPYIDTDTRTIWYAISLEGPDYWTTNDSVTTSNMPFITVTDYGAVPDGVTPCSYAINSAIRQASSMSQFGTIYFPGGTYLIDAPIVLEDNIHLIGDGFTTLKQANNTSMKSMIYYYSSKTSNPHDYYTMSIQDLILDGNNYTNTSYNPTSGASRVNCGIILEKAHSCHIDSVEIKNFGYDGLVLEDHTGCDHNMFTNVRIRDNGRSGVHIGKGCSSNKFLDCMIEYNRYTNVECYGAFNNIDACRLSSSNYLNGISFYDRDNTLQNSEITDNGQSGIVCHGGSSYSTLINNKLAGNSKVSQGTYPHISVGVSSSGYIKGVHIAGNHFLGTVSSMTDYGYATPCVKLGLHEGCHFASNSVYFNTEDCELSLSTQFIEGLTQGDTHNGITIINSDQRPRPTLGSIYLEEDTGLLCYYNFADRKWMVLREPPGDNSDLIVSSLTSSSSVRCVTLDATTSVSSPTISASSSMSSPQITATNISATSITATGTIQGDSVSTPEFNCTETSALAKASATSLSVTGNTTLGNTSVTSITATGAVQGNSVSTPEFNCTGSSTLANTSATSLSVTGNTTLSDVSSDSIVSQSISCVSFSIGANKILFSDSVPTGGTYKSGDLIINTATSSDIFLWKYCDEETGWVELKISTTDTPDGDGTA